MTGIFIESIKASDSVDHEIPLNRLEDVGVREVTVVWFQSYFVRQFHCEDSKIKLAPLLLLYVVLHKGRC